jgi:bifunctional DNase/RNase
MLIEMRVTGIAVDPMTEMPILILKDLEASKVLPIWIGLLEAGAIASELEHIKLARPMSHDLMKRLVDELSVQVLQVEITDLRENTYYASVVLKHGTRVFELDARPSDAIALALRAGCPVLVEESVIEKAQEIDLRARDSVLRGEGDSAADPLGSLPNQAFGKWKM